MKTAKLTSAILLATIASVGFSSCSKDDKDEPMPKIEKRLTAISEKTYVEGGRSEASEIFYDTDGRVSSVKTKYTDGFGNTNIGGRTYEYHADRIIMKEIYPYASDEETETIYYITDGLIVSSQRPDELQNFQYDGKKLTIAKTDSYTIQFNWNNDDIISTSQNSIAASENCNYTYEYYSENDFGHASAFIQDFYFYDVLDKYLVMQGYFGIKPTHMLKEVKQTYDEDHHIDYLKCSYTYDEDGYPTLADYTSHYKSLSTDNYHQQRYSISFTWENIR